MSEPRLLRESRCLQFELEAHVAPGAFQRGGTVCELFHLGLKRLDSQDGVDGQRCFRGVLQILSLTGRTFDSRVFALYADFHTVRTRQIFIASNLSPPNRGRFSQHA